MSMTQLWTFLAANNTGAGVGESMGSGGNFSIDGVLSKLKTNLVNWGGAIIVIAGIIMIIVGVVQLARGLMSKGRSQTNWLMVALLIIVGAALAAGGFAWIANIGKGLSGDIDALGTMLLPLFPG